MVFLPMFRLAIGLALVVIAASARAAGGDDVGTAKFFERCSSPAVVVCLPLDTASSINKYRTTPSYLKPSDWIQLDPAMGAARFTIPSRTGADTSGMLHIPFPQPLINTYVSFDVRYPADFLHYKSPTGGGWKMFILGQGKEGCSPYAVVGGNDYYAGFPFFYYMCTVFASVVTNTRSDNLGEWDQQPGGDTECLAWGRHPGRLPCARFVPDEWVTYQIHVDSTSRLLEVWQTVRGKTIKIIDFTLVEFPKVPPAFEWIKLTPYNTGMSETEEHPRFSIWYRRVIASTSRIPSPQAE